MYTGHRRTLAKVSNGILTGLTDQGKPLITIFYKLIVLLKKIIHDQTSLYKMFGWYLTFDAVYMFSAK